MSLETRKKVVIIGLDGADWRLLRPWMADGRLPTLARLQAEGTTGPLRSTIRPESSVAWSSFATGVNPGKHGVYGFVRWTEGYDFQLANSSSVGAPRFWGILDRAGYNVGLINIPFTYPPDPIHGFLVSGMLTPNADVAFAYPQAVQSRLLARFKGNLLFDAGDREQNKNALVAHVGAYTRQQREMVSLLWEEPWDLLAVVFTGPDRLQHFLWADTDSDHPLHKSEDGRRYGDALLEHFQVLDAAVKQIVERLPSDSLVLIMSDHGFNGCGRRFYVNNWLKAGGYLRPRGAFAGWKIGARILRQLKRVPWLRRVKRRILPDEWGPTHLQTTAFSQAFDWSRTKAYFAPDGGIRINLKGREPAGIVPPSAYDSLLQELQEALRSLVDEETGAAPLHEVYRREELYHGRYANVAPDLILEPQREKGTALHNYVLDGSTAKGEAVFTTSHPYSGNHAPNGILMAWGEGVKAGASLSGARIIDIAPTVLATLGAPIPQYMDGRFLENIFIPSHAPYPEYTDELSLTDSGTRPFTGEEAAAVASRLQNLGYLD